MSVEWFQRMGDIPGFKYEGPALIQRDSFPGHDAEPEVHQMDMDGRTRSYLSWGRRELPREPDEDVSSTSLGAPVSEHVREALEDPDVGAPELLARLWEALELPGTAEDYHNVLERVLARLWAKRAGAPEVLPAVEELAWLDVRLMVAYPDTALLRGMGGKPTYWRATAFRALRDIYLSEGFLRDALQVAELEVEHFGHAAPIDTPRARRLGSPTGERDELKDRLEAIGNESAI